MNSLLNLNCPSFYELSTIDINGIGIYLYDLSFLHDKVLLGNVYYDSRFTEKSSFFSNGQYVLNTNYLNSQYIYYSY